MKKLAKFSSENLNENLHGDLNIIERILCLTDAFWASLTLIWWSSGSSRGLLETLKGTLGYLPDNMVSF